MEGERGSSVHRISRCVPLLAFEAGSGVAAEMGAENSPLQGRPTDPKCCSHRQALFSALQLGSRLYRPERLYGDLPVLSVRTRSSWVLCAFFVVESLLAKKDVAAHT